MPKSNVRRVNGVEITGTPNAGDVPTATSATEAAWAPPGGGAPDLTDAVILAPTSDTRNTIVPGSDRKNLVLKSRSAQTAHLLEFQDSAGNVLFYVNPSSGDNISWSLSTQATLRTMSVANTGTGDAGRFSASGASGKGVIGDSKADASGHFRSNNASNTVATLVAQQKGASTANLQEWQNDAGAVLSSVDYLGKFVGNGSLLTNLPAPLPAVNVETLSANKTLTAGTDAQYQYLNPNGADRAIQIATGTVAGQRFVIRNNIAYNAATSYRLQVYVSGQFSTYVYSGGVLGVIWDGSYWRPSDFGYGQGSTIGYGYENISIGSGADGHNHGLAIGQSSAAKTYGAALGEGAAGYTYGTGVGYNAQGYTYGAAVGSNSTAYNYSASLGANANSNGKSYAIAIGNYSKNERYGEHVESIDHQSTQKYSRSWVGFNGATTNATPTELYIHGVSSNRLTVIASSAFMFTAEVIAYCNGATKGKTWLLQGGIRRDGSNNTALIGTVVKTVISEDGTTGYDVNLTADNTNESLKVEVTGAASETVRWTVDVKLTECRF